MTTNSTGAASQSGVAPVRVANPADPSTILVWIGRFAEVSGYSSAARTYLNICRDIGVPIIAVDVKTAQVVGPSCGIPITITQGREKTLTIEAPDRDTRFLAVLHETPPLRERVHVEGRTRLVNYTVFETDALPQAWLGNVLDFDEVWTASEFNQRTFTESGVPSFMIRQVPHALDPALEHGDIEPMRIQGARSYVMLSVLSAFNRKDAGGLLRAYCQAFSNQDDVTLVLKVRGDLDDELIESHINRALAPDVDPNSSDNPHIIVMRETLSDERLWALYKRADAYVSLERGRGWDLPAMEAMAVGTPVATMAWGGIEAFLGEHNAMVIPRSPTLVGADAALVQGHSMYAGHRWATYRPSDAAATLRRLYEDGPLRRSLSAAGAETVRSICSGVRVASIIKDRMDELTPADFRNVGPAKITLRANASASPRPPAQPAGISGSTPASVRVEHRAEATRLLAHLREVKATPVWRPRRKLARLEGMMAAYHAAKTVLPPEHPVAGAFERFAVVPRSRAMGKLSAYRTLAAQEEALLYAASDMTEVDPLEPYRPGEDLDAWIKRRKALWAAHGSVPPAASERARLSTLRNRHAGEKIVIMGNAPSLRKVNFDALREYPTFAANRIYLAYDKTEWRPTYYTALDWRVTPDNHEEINALRDSTFFFPNRFRGLLRNGPDVYWYHSVGRSDRWREQFETDATLGVRGLGTVVTAMLQLAWHMGYRDFVLIGVDADYTVPSTVKQSGPARFDTGNRLELTSTRDDDANHFDPRYFGAGKRWHDPNVDEMVRCFWICRKVIEARGGRIVNATPGGKLEAFERVSIEDELGPGVLAQSGVPAEPKLSHAPSTTGPTRG